MKLNDILENVLAFPTKERKHQVTLDKLKAKSKYYDEITGQPTDDHPTAKSFLLVSDDNKAVATFDTWDEAEKQKPSVEMRHGVRGLRIVPMG